MAKRFKLGKSRSKKMFTRNAVKVHPRNQVGFVMRGGIRA